MNNSPATAARKALREAISHLTYKPGWEFFVMPRPENEWPGRGGELIITIMPTYKQLDVVTGKLSDFHNQKSIVVHSDGGFNYSTYWAVEQIKFLIRYTEEHEFREWLRFDGECIENPHPERKAI